MKLNNQISIFIPSTVEGNKPARMMQRKETKRASKYFCSYFGGTTEQPANGYYISDSKGLIKEKQNIIYSACTDEALTEHENKIFAYAKRLCRRMKQEAVTVKVNNNMYFVSAE